MRRTSGSQRTGETICSTRSGTIAAGSVPLGTLAPVEFMYTSHLGGLIRGSAAFSAASSLPCAGFMRSVWNAPDVFSSLVCSAPSFSTATFSASTALLVPAHEKPLWKSTFAIWHTSPPTACARQCFDTVSWSRPAIDSMACGVIFAASSIALPRTITSLRPSSKVKTPATQSAEYSPSDRPATPPGFSTASGRAALSFSTAAKLAKYMAGWTMLVSSSLLSMPGPQTSRRS
mmetsp:Transcript_122934/g.348440  ORF Transcript_122934/g.348440 Transcript_122934/m.348440 type:complete len:232 (-) Transcript_122934:99-794(-)